MTISKAYSYLEQEKVVERRPGRPLIVRAVEDDRARTQRIDQLRAHLVPVATVVRIHQAEGDALHAVELIHEIVVLPAADHAIFADGFTPGWEVEYTYGVELDPNSAEEVLAGNASLAVRAQNFTIDLAAADPVEPVGYRALHLAFHPGNADGGRKPAFNLLVNADARTAVKLLETDAQEFGLRLDLPAWQEVEIPLTAFGDFEAPIHSLRLLGNLQGTFFLDDVRLIAARPAAEPTAVSVEQDLPQTFALSQNFPNPFNSATTIRFSLPAPAPVQIIIFNLTGQQVRTLASAPFPPGAHTIPWDGRDQQGRDLASGLYLYQLRASDLVQTRKMLLLR